MHPIRPPISLALVTILPGLALPRTLTSGGCPWISDQMPPVCRQHGPRPRRGFSEPTSWLAPLPSWLGCQGCAGVGVGGSQEDSDYSVNTACQYLLLPGARASPSHLLPLQVPQTSLVRRSRPSAKTPTKTLSCPRPQFPHLRKE